MDPLTRRWRADCLRAAPSAETNAVDAVGADLAARWREPHRRYHDVTHLTEVLSAVDSLCARATLRSKSARTAALLAGWFHDAVYEAAPHSENERASADLARVSLGGLGVDVSLVDLVVTVVEDTIDHDLPWRGAHDVDEARVVFHDADLWILGAPVQRFDEYCRQVRAEFAHVPSGDYAEARTAVLRPFLVRPHVYLTEHARHEWEAAARENLAREITRLAG